MLTADQIEALGNKAQKLLDPVQEFLIREIASRISEAGSMTATAQYQVWRLQNLGKSQKEIKKQVAKLLKVSEKKLEQLMLDAGEDGYTYDLASLPSSEAIPFRESKVMQDIVSAAAELAREDLTNITQTMGFCLDPQGKVCLPLTQAYEQACDTAFMRVSTGAKDFKSAVREATQGLARRGIQYIDYESGIHTSLEAATRRSIMGGMGLMQEKISQGVHDEYGCNGWEISAHACSAPDHEPIQGKQYSDDEYQALNNSLRRRIGTLNCGHAAHPIILGISRPQYTEKELRSFREENQKGVEIDEKQYTMYEATQKQRAIERAMRAQKKKILVAEATGDPELPQLQSRMQVLSQEYSRFSDQAGLRTQVERTQVADNVVIPRDSGEYQLRKPVLLEGKTVETKIGTVNLRRVRGYDSKVFVSEKAKLESEEIRAFVKRTHDAMDEWGIPKKYRPEIQIMDLSELGAFGTYDAKTDVVKYASVIKSQDELDFYYALNKKYIDPEDIPPFGETELHEMWHLAQAVRFREKGWAITDKNYSNYLKALRKNCKLNLEKKGITEYNQVKEISAYAAEAFEHCEEDEIAYDEIEAEYMVKHGRRKR